ncbi:hypothetical protein PRK78_006895 [Emydomyces testavorans]|uniref:Uncharacterized protein n=1 Tax=Emydomyces testavorans TaxID=2070801 RepID=A0AAF0IKY3_9EURO|nr:hypothetical protein PRK78_006895 [Emydomyces testavorans]
MFRFHKPLDIITLFHKPTLPSSLRALALLKQASANAAQADADTTPNANGTSTGRRRRRGQFELNVTEDAPTPDELRLIMEYMGAGRRVGELVSGAVGGREDAVRRVREDGGRFVRPVVVDWNNGRAVLGTNESAILKLLEEEPPSTPDNTP